MNTAADFEAKLEQISEYEHTDTDQARCDVENVLIDIGSRVREWDTEDAEELLALLTLLKETAKSWGMTGDLAYYVVDMTDLPSAEIPVRIDTSYPLWAVDKRGRALAGAAADEIVDVCDLVKYGVCERCCAPLVGDGEWLSCPVYVETGDENHTSLLRERAGGL